MSSYGDRLKDTTTTTGTGAVTLSGSAPIGYRTFSSVFAVGDLVRGYVIVGTTEWEVGIGNYSATNTLTRTTVTASSNANALVNFSAGSKDVWCDIPAWFIDSIQGQLVAAASGLAMP